MLQDNYKGVAHRISILQYVSDKETCGFSQWIKLWLFFDNKKVRFEGEFSCLGENMEKCKTFSVSL